MHRGAQWQDSGHHQLRALTHELVNEYGLALSHPLHQWLCRASIAILPVEPSVACTFVSAVTGATAVANVFGCVFMVTRRREAGLFAAISLGFAATFWQMSTLTESYTLCAALLAGECWALAGLMRHRRAGWAYAAAMCNGLGIANHMLASLTTPVVALVLLTEWRNQPYFRAKQLWIAAAAWVVGSMPYTFLILEEAVRTGDLMAAIHSALFGTINNEVNVLNTGLTMRVLLIDVAFPIYNFPNLLIPAAMVGLMRPARIGVPVTLRRAFLAALVIHAVFILRYNISDQHTFFLPLYTMLAILGGIGGAVVLQSTRWARLRVLAIVLLVLTPVFYFLFPSIARPMNVLAGQEYSKPYRDDYVYVFTPWMRADISAERMSTEAVALAGPDGMILYEDEMARFALRYKAERAGTRDDVTITFTQDLESMVPVVEAVGRNRPVVLVPVHRDKPKTEAPLGQWSRRGDLYVLDAKAVGG